MLMKPIRDFILVTFLFSFSTINLKSQEINPNQEFSDQDYHAKVTLEKFIENFVKKIELASSSDLLEDSIVQLSEKEIELIEANKHPYAYIPEDLADAFNLLLELDCTELSKENCTKICTLLKEGTHVASLDLLYKATDELSNILGQIESLIDKEKHNILMQYIEQCKKALENGDVTINIENLENKSQRCIACKTFNNLCVHKCLKAGNLIVSGTQSITGQLTANKISSKSIDANNITSNDINTITFIADSANVDALSVSSLNVSQNIDLNTAHINQLTVGPIIRNVRAATCSPTDDALCVIGNATVEGKLNVQDFKADNFTIANVNIAGDINSTNGNISAPNGTVSGATISSSALIAQTAKINSLGAGVVHADNMGTLSSSLIVNNNIANGTIADNKLVSTITSTNMPNTIVKRDGSGNFVANVITGDLNGNAATATTAGTTNNFNGNLLGDVIGTQNTTVVSFVGGQPASNIASSTQLVNDATSLNTPNTIVKRDGSGNFVANVITGDLNGNAATATTAGTTNNFNGNLLGDVIGTQNTTVVSFVGGQPASNVASSTHLVNDATSLNTPNTIVKRDGSGDISVNEITGQLIGNVTGAAYLNVLKSGDTMTGPLNLSGPLSTLTVDGMLTVNGASSFTNGVPGIAANVLLVTKGQISGPNEFNSVKTAVDSIGGSSSAINPYVVKIGAGLFIEDTIVLPRFVALVGESPFSCIIEVDNPNKDIIIGAQNSSVENCILRGATAAGKAAIVHNDIGVFRIFHCRFGKNDILVKSTAIAPSTALVVQDSSVDADSNFSIGFLLRGTLTTRSATAVTDFLWQPTTVQSQLQSFVDISGENTTFLGSAITIGSPTTVFIGGTAFNVQQASTLRIAGAAMIGFDRAIYMPNTVIGQRIEASGLYCRLNNKDLVVENPLASGSVIGAFSPSTDKVDIDPSANIALLLTDPENPSLTSVGPQFNGNNIDTITNVSVQLQRGSNIGVMSGGDLSIGIGLNVDVDAGSGYLMTGTAPNNNLKYVQWNAQSITLPANQDNILFIANDGTLNSALSIPDPINTIIVGRARTTATGILYLQLTPRQATHTATLLDDSWINALGNIYISGSIVSKNGTVQLNVTPGKYVLGTLEFVPSGGTAISWDAFYKDNIGNLVVIEGQNMVDFQQYNDLSTGTLVPIPAGQFARHTLYLVGDGPTETYLFVYAQQTYATLNAAEEGVVPVAPSTWGANIVLIASLIVENTGLPNASSISQITDERPRLGFKASSIAGTDIHGDLLGLLADDHPQYLLVNGTRTMSGDLDLGSSNITNVNLVDGVDIPSHAARHLPTGADPLTIASPVSIGTSNQIGTQASFALSDHVHDHGSLPGGSLHNLATNLTAGFMSAADKALLDSINPVDFVQKSGDTMTGTLNLLPTSGLALTATGVLGSPAISITPEASSKGIAINNTTGNALEINTDKFTVIGSTGETNIAGKLTVQDTTQLNLSVGVVHSDNTGTLTSSSIVNSDISNSAAIDYQKLNLTNSIVDNDINVSAAIQDSKLATISSSGKVANSATTATDLNTANAIVSRDNSGNFSAGAITAQLLGNVTGSASLNVLKSGDSMTGALNINPGTGTALNIIGNSVAPAVIITPTVNSKGIAIDSTSGNAIEVNTNKFTVIGSTGNTNIAGNLQVDSSTLLNGQLTVNGNTILSALSGTAGVVHSDNSGNLSSSLIVNNDITNSTISDNKLASQVASINTANAIVKRDGSGNFAANIITANLSGNASTATTSGTANNFSGNLLGDVTGIQNSTVVSVVGGETATNIATATQLANNAASSNASNTLVKRDSSGNFSADTITAQLIGNVTGSASNNVLKSGDTMTGILSVNTAGNAIRVSDGTVAAPSLSFINQNNTGLYRIGANSMGLSVNGINKGIIDNAAASFASNYRVSVYAGADRTTTAANEVVRFNTELFDSNNNFDTTTFRYTAPVSGVYLVSVQLSVQTQGTTTIRSIQLLKNGVLQTGYSSVATLTRNIRNMLNLSSIILLAAGDTLSVQYSGVVGDVIKLADTSLNIHLLST